MFTVCPKCALTLVVTAADLRVAQGYVRCGRCSNVFNALARLSEDRHAAAATAAQAEQESSTSAKHRQALDAAAATTRKAALPTPPPPAPPPKRYDDDSIPEEDLEFNPEGTDLNKVFVEQPPSPKFTAATGTFKAIRLEAQDSARAEAQPAAGGERKAPADERFDPIDTQVDVDIDPDLLATMAQLTSNRLERLDPTLPGPDLSSGELAEPAKPTSAASSAGPPKTAPPAKQPTLLQPPMEQPRQAPASMRLAERAKARAEAARTGTDPARALDTGLKPEAKQPTTAAPTLESKRASAIETTRAIRAALTPRRRPPASNMPPAATAQPTSGFAGMWTAGSALLLLALVIQVVHHYRHDLAANATLNGPLTSIYGGLGITIVPRWDIAAYEVRQLGASTAAEAPGQITVRASVKNAARQAQPLPLLRVTLQDRFGNRIASRDVPPQSYLPRAIPPSSLLSAGQRIDAEMSFVDPGSNAVGFEIDACLPAPGDSITCANDSAS